MSNLLGIDFGTTALKASLFNSKGERLASESCQYELITKGEFVEFDVEEFFNIFKGALEKITSKFSVDAMAIDTQGETLIVLDKNGKPLMNAIIWLDNRAEEQAKKLEKQFGVKYVYERTGQAEIPAGYPAPKIMWLKENCPEIFEKADKFLLLEDYIIYRLTGKACASRSLYTSSLLMDIHTGEYIKEMLDFIGITEDNLPTLYESGEVVGEYNGIKITASAIDQIANVTGAGVISEGVISDTTGTSLAVSALTTKFPPYYEGLKVSAYYVRRGVYCLLMWAPTAGATLEWFRKNFYNNADFCVINEEALSAGLGAEGLVCLPHLCGTVMPENNANVKGSFFGMTLKHNCGHFVRAIMESIAYTVKEYADFIGGEVKEVRLMGGGAKSDLWCNIKAGVINKPLNTLVENETACLGSALFAGVGTGVYSSLEQAVKVVKLNKKYLPKDNYVEFYQKEYLRYKQIEKKLIEIY